MTPFQLHHGDCLEVLRGLPSDSVDAIVTDPPYGLTANKKGGTGVASVNLESPYGRERIGTGNGAGGFMGLKWDSDVPPVEVWAECLRVLKPGGHLLAFAGTRTQHRMAVRIEDAGFEIRDLIAWVYGSGFPKSLDVSKAIDKAGGASPREQSEMLRAKRKAAGLSREQIAEVVGCTPSSVRDWEEGRARAAGAAVEFIVPSNDYRTKLADLLGYSADERRLIGASADRRGDGSVYGVGHSGDLRAGGNTDAARQWAGWGTALKPALEPITVARKPLAGTVADNVLRHGTGGLNIDGCRVDPTGESRERVGEASQENRYTEAGGTNFAAKPGIRGGDPPGRWPANLIHDGSDEVLAAFPQAKGQQGAVGPQYGDKPSVNAYGDFGPRQDFQPRGDAGSAARFFKECNQWQDQSPSLSSADTAAPSLCLQSTVAATVQSAAATWPSLAGIVSSDSKEPSTSATASECESIAEVCTAAMTAIGSGCLQESRHEKPIQNGSLASAAVTRKPTGITTITASLWRSDGSVERATCSITPTSLDRGAAASRLRYCAKASKADRGSDNAHPTVKPTDLMRYLCRLVTPPGGVVLDPFMGSGSTGKAALLEGFRFIGIEREESYLAIARARIAEAETAQNQKPRDLFEAIA